MDHANRSTTRMAAAWGGRAVLSACLFALGYLISPYIAARQLDGSESSVADDADALKPGEYSWSGDEVGEGPVLVMVFLGAQRARIYRGGFLIGVTTISSGKRGYTTPTGVFSILQKKRFHRSNLYDNAPMPFMLRLTWDGLAIHGGVVPGRPASHGCIRLPPEFARKLFGIVKFDAVVVVTEL